jgi:hypothetical protein
MRKLWSGDKPKHCDLCKTPFKKGDAFVDGKVAHGLAAGAWGIMCVPDHAKYGMGLGTGKGQKFDWSSGRGE